MPNPFLFGLCLVLWAHYPDWKVPVTIYGAGVMLAEVVKDMQELWKKDDGKN